MTELRIIAEAAHEAQCSKIQKLIMQRLRLAVDPWNFYESLTERWKSDFPDFDFGDVNWFVVHKSVQALPTS
eukprot:5335361-Karenia_brevis.AAC.1